MNERFVRDRNGVLVWDVSGGYLTQQVMSASKIEHTDSKEGSPIISIISRVCELRNTC